MELRVVPGARRNEVAGRHGNAIKVRCQAPALDGRANQAVTEILAERLGVRRSDVVLVQGERSRDKIVEVRGLSRDEIWTRLDTGGDA